MMIEPMSPESPARNPFNWSSARNIWAGGKTNIPSGGGEYPAWFLPDGLLFFRQKNIRRMGD